MQNFEATDTFNAFWTCTYKLFKKNWTGKQTNKQKQQICGTWNLSLGKKASYEFYVEHFVSKLFYFSLNIIRVIKPRNITCVKQRKDGG